MGDRGRSLLIAGVGLAVIVALGVGAFVFLRPEDTPGPEDAAASFVDAWEAGDLEEMRALVAPDSRLDEVDPVAIAESLGTTATEVALGEVEEREEGEGADARVTVTLTLGEIGDIIWETVLPIVDVEDEGWRVAWVEESLHPELPEGGAFDVVTTWAARAPILGAGDRTLAGPIETIRVGIEPQRFDRAASTPILAGALGLDPAAIDAALDAPGVEPDHFVEVAVLRREEFDAVRDVIYPIPGVTFPTADGRGGPTAGFARHIIGRVGEVTAERLEELGAPYAVGDQVGLDGLESRYERELAGTPAAEVHIVDAEGEVVVTVGSFPGTPPTPLTTTLDPDIQRAAEAALAEVTVPAALVAVDAATGKVRAVVSRPLAEAFDRAIGGAYPPGSTFKVVTGYALLTNGMTPDTTVDCPATIEVDGRAFRNFEGGASGPVPFSTAFANSCNTAFIGAASALPDGALAAAADTFGFGLDYSLGPTTLGGSFPAPASEVEAAASAIGQAAVTASPLHMATVAAAALDGTWRSPVLIPGDADPAVTIALDAPARTTLTSLMLQVVTDGSGTAADVDALEVIGKTGTAEFGDADPPATHAWFIGAANGLGFAVLLEGGGVGGRDAAPLAARFLEGLSR